MPAPSTAPAESSSRQPSDWTYLVGIGGYAVLDTVLQLWLIFFFIPPPDQGSPLVDPQTFGLAILVGRTAEALMSPVAGFSSDRLGKPWLFLLGGALIFGLSSILLFFLPVPGDSTRNTLLLFILLPIGLLGQASYIVPYLGLLPRVALDSVRRIRLTNSQALLILTGVFTGQVVSGLVLKTLGNLPLTVTLFFSLAVGLMLLPLVRVRSLQTQGSGFAFLEIAGILRRNRGFRALVAAQGLFWLGFNMVRSVVVYYVTVLLGGSAGDVALYLGAIFVVTLPSLVLIRFLVPIVGKRRMMMTATGMLALILPLLSTIGLNVGPLPAQAWAFGLLGLSGFPLAILSAVPNPMVAEQVDGDAAVTGQNKSALFFGVQALAIKISAGLAGALLGFLLANFGYSQANPLGIQLVGPIAGLLAMAATIAYSFYPEEVT